MTKIDANLTELGAQPRRQCYDRWSTSIDVLCVNIYYNSERRL